MPWVVLSPFSRSFLVWARWTRWIQHGMVGVVTFFSPTVASLNSTKVLTSHWYRRVVWTFSGWTMRTVSGWFLFILSIPLCVADVSPGYRVLCGWGGKSCAETWWRGWGWIMSCPLNLMTSSESKHICSAIFSIWGWMDIPAAMWGIRDMPWCVWIGHGGALGKTSCQSLLFCWRSN